MQPVNNIGSFQGVDGQVIGSLGITFEPANYHFYSGGQDITDIIKRGDKLRLVNGFDQGVENDRVYRERVYPATHGGVAGPPQGETNVWTLFGQNMQQSVSNIAKPTENMVGSIVKYTIIGLIIYFVVGKVIAHLASKSKESHE